MNKQEAVEFIKDGLQSGLSQQEIVAELSQQLGAPPDVVSKFVAQISSQVPAPDLLQPTPAPPVPTSTSVDPSTVQPAQAEAPSVSAAPQSPGGDQPVSAGGLPLAAGAGGAGSPAALALPAADEMVQQQAPTADQFEDDEKLERLIVSALGKNRKQNDVVLAVCERTGMNWDQSQRLVSRVAAKNRNKLKRQQNFIAIPISAVALLAGLALLFASVQEMYVFSQAIQDADPTAVYYAQDLIREGFWALATGAALVLGGAVGLFLALRSQFEH